jgi:hypothetical protein
MVDILLIFSLAGFVAWSLKERALYVLFMAAYTQNLIVPFLFTHGYIGLDLARALVLLKDSLLLLLFVWCGSALFKKFRSPWPRPLILLFFFTSYCLFRFALGALFLNDDWTEGLYRLKIICFPLEILVVVIVLTALKPEFAQRFLRFITYTLALLAVVAIAILIWAPRDFWVENANIAVLQADVKGDVENEMNFEEGLSLSGTMQGREVLAFLGSFRAIGTFGEPLSLSFSMAVPVLLLSFYFKSRAPAPILALMVSGAALLFSLARSGWIFCGIVGAYVLLRQRRYRPFMFIGGSIVAFFLLWPPMAEFVTNTVTNISPSADNPDSGHAEGILWFYTHGFSDTGNILGKGMKPEAQSIPESGYAYLMEHFGAVAYASFVWFCISLYRQFGQGRPGSDVLFQLAQGIPLGVLVVTHFSQYAFSLPAFMSLWYVVGLCLGSYLTLKEMPESAPAVLKARVPRIQPA